MAGTTGGGRDRRGAMISQINVTPLCDILLVLLIIFMVASTYIVSQAIKVELPKAANSDGSSQGPAVVTLTEDDKVRWNGEEIAEEEFEGLLKDAVALDAQLELIVSADQEVKHGRVVRFIDISKTAGVKRFAINVEKTE